MAALLMVPRQRKERIFRGMVSHLNNLTDTEMRTRYRFGRDSIAYICNIVGDKLRRSTTKETALTVEQQVCIALRFYASGSFLQVIGDTMGYDKATVSRAVNDVTNALLDVKDNFIQWPKDINSINRMKCGFHRQMNFPNVLGCIDCTHVKIQGPSEDEAAFVNRKGYHSVNVQAVCDYEGKFTNISANWPGSTHDSHIFNTSNLCHYLETNNRRLADGLILGDSGYACRPFLMTPYPNPRERHQQRFNRAHSSTRSIIERAFGILKRRFHVLHSEVRMKPEKVCRVFGAYAVLHNIALTRNEPLDDVFGVHVQQDQPVQVPHFEGEQDGRHIREHIARVFFN
ncbi:putative nuclease HARBI1 [Mytilus californianus]|uniref:putative nuclease HARBI1 n=1 Tax=Mytilus californianus TaxID=6549 RepID=UPI0022476B3B|nr:putative nuclease HARBI1 [Mytilus californianus]